MVWFESIKDRLEYIVKQRITKAKGRLSQAVFMLTCWRIWMGRNEKVFKGITTCLLVKRWWMPLRRHRFGRF
ncbi:hypothetical protein HanHA300_Chr13g0466771 [Helianthus annuus]|nr:hypothetical protein HanHA300_Chr13g0466771 [Helianthus annuus]KAJ0496335.1 hypothetical protein HanHA89_Chr13g0498511 [Helianthus annuus]KAJ0662394.1 hypothetical protein HanLR1_Chr13g0468941 [Helianthus annuus]KAJ0669921.1 hypothetical protein HanOQP8_Chr13g0468031 [Helianthus annuus]